AGTEGKYRPFLATQRRGKKRGKQSAAPSRVDWFLWRPCAGAGQHCPPLARWSDMLDGTYTIDDVQLMHDVLDEIAAVVERGLG
ncbi:hypothetical protein, partial [Yersinia enterocolitica]|uniref:hypothetical protein n=1 Tax=Yersinia enterocolitica TaxID=630 RepID=UPI003F48A269